MWCIRTSFDEVSGWSALRYSVVLTLLVGVVATICSCVSMCVGVCTCVCVCVCVCEEYCYPTLAYTSIMTTMHKQSQCK